MLRTRLEADLSEITASVVARLCEIEGLTTRLLEGLLEINHLQFANVG